MYRRRRSYSNFIGVARLTIIRSNINKKTSGFKRNFEAMKDLVAPKRPSKLFIR